MGLDALIRRVAKGDAEAMEALHRCLFDALTRFIWKRYHPPLDFQDAEDVASETLAQIWRHAPHYRGLHAEASARRWVLRIAHHQALRRIKALQRLSLIPLEQCAMKPDPSFTPNALQEALALKEAWERFFTTCTPRERQILRWRYEGFTLADIGQRLDISPPRVHQILRQLHRRFHRIRDALGSTGDGPASA